MDFSQPEQSERVRVGLAQRVDSRMIAQGSVTLPAVPGMAGRFADKFVRIFAELGRPFSDSERAHLEGLLHQALTDGFTRSQRSSVTVDYQCQSNGGINYRVAVNVATIEQAYNEWLSTREPPLFGVDPDARVVSLAGEAADPSTYRVLDLGAGTGRNGLALARRGHPVDAVEMTAQFADGMRAEALRDGLDVTVIQRDIFDAKTILRDDYSLIVASEVVPEFRDAGELRRLFEMASRGLAPGGRLVFNAFVAHPTYDPDEAARQAAQQAYSMFFTRAETADAAAGLDLELVDDVRALDYEQAHLPDGAWPPTKWYPNWSSGTDIFGLAGEDCPVDLRWLVYRKN